MIAALIIASSSVLTPPKHYVHPPRQPMQVQEASPSDLPKLCRKAPRYRNGKILACALPFKELCHIVWPEGVPRSGPVWDHEIAHCNGWRH